MLFMPRAHMDGPEEERGRGDGIPSAQVGNRVNVTSSMRKVVVIHISMKETLHS